MTRKQAISSVPWMSGIPPRLVDAMTRELMEEEFSANEDIFLEGDLGDRFAIITSGKARVSILDASRKPVIVATLESGSTFGELALLNSSGRRNATVTACSRLRVLTLRSEVFQCLLRQEPKLELAVKQVADRIEIANFLKLCTPFSSLDRKAMTALERRVKHLSVPEGQVVLKQGEWGDTCYLIRAGRVEVILASDGQERILATLGQGSLFGEAALLFGSPRSASVRALEPLELLSLDRTTLLDAAGAGPTVSRKLMEMLQLRGRPRQVAAAEIHARSLPDGDVVYLLKHPSLGTYFRLSPRGLFLWGLLDGENGTRELMSAYFLKYKSFDPESIVQTLSGLAAAGFLEGAPLHGSRTALIAHASWWQRISMVVRSTLEASWTLRNVNPWFQRLYTGGIKYVYAPLSLVAMAAITVAGAIAFLVSASTGLEALGSDPKLRWFIFPAMLLATALHEMGHAFTTVRSGRQVNGLGVGWFWFGPVAFVDTSDMWLADRRHRIAVTAAGPAVNLFVAGSAGLLSVVISNRVAAAGLWQFSWLNYLIVAFNLNPLLELDGYYLLMDWLERPNFRAKTLAWIRRELPSAFRVPGVLRAHRVELIYAAASLLYLIVFSAVTALSIYGFLRGLLVHWVSAVTSEYFSISLALLVLSLFMARIISDLRYSNSQRP